MEYQTHSAHMPYYSRPQDNGHEPITQDALIAVLRITDHYQQTAAI